MECTHGLAMSDLRILQAGLPKSGNLWLYRIFQNILELHGAEQRSFIRRFRDCVRSAGVETHTDLFGHDVIVIEDDKCYVQLSRKSRLLIDEPREYAQACVHVWTHSPVSDLSGTVFPLFDRIVYVLRDPRDVAISLSHFVQSSRSKRDLGKGFANVDDFLRHRFEDAVYNWTRHVAGHLRVREELRIHFVFYERLLQCFDEELRSLLDHLGVDLSPESLSELKSRVSFDAMHQANPSHVRQGQANKWMSELSSAHKKSARKIAAPLLELLNYPIDATADGIALPEVPRAISDGTLESIEEHARRNFNMYRGKRALLKRLRLSPEVKAPAENQ